MRHLLDWRLTDMDLVILTVAPGVSAANRILDPAFLTDILWANARTADRIEHLRVTTGPYAETYTVGIFLLPNTVTGDGRDDTTSTALRLCRSAFASSPMLAGWSAIPAAAPHDWTIPERR